MRTSFIDLIEIQELINKLIEKGYGQLVDILLNPESYTKKDRLNKSSVCRQLGWKAKQLEDALEECEQLLDIDFNNLH